MTTFLNPGPAREKLVGSGVFFEGSIGVVGHESGGGVGSQDEMDTDHFNELDHIFDLSYSAEQDPFGSGSGHAQSQGTGYGHPPQTQLGGASLLMPHPHNSHGAISHDGSRMHNDGMDWRAKDEDCSYHTAVDASCHIDSSYHHVDASGHSMVDASGHSTIDASGHDSLIDSSGHYDDYLAHKGDARYMEHSCEACKRSKKRCNRRNPCQICTSRGIKCVPQIRGPGRPPGSKSSRGCTSLSLSSSRHGSSRGDIRAANGSGQSHNSSATTSAASSTSSSLSRSLSGNGLLQQGQELAVGARRHSPPRDPWHCRFFFEAARHCKEAFLRTWHDNELDTAKCIMLRNLWTKVSSQLASGTDMTFGICDQLQEVVGPAPTGSGPMAGSPATRSKSHAAQQAQLLTHPGSKEAMGPHCLPLDLRRMEDGVSMLCGFMFLQDELFVYTDERFAATFMTREEVESKVGSLAVLPILLLAEIFHPDDLPDIYAAIGAYWFSRRSSTTSESGSSSSSSTNSSVSSAGSRESAASATGTPEASWICKCIDKANTEVTAFVRFRSFVAPAEGYPGAAMLSILPLKPSKYLADPDTKGSVRSGVSSRLQMRDTFGALPTALPEQDDEDLGDDLVGRRPSVDRMEGLGPGAGEGQDPESDDALFRPLRRGMTVLSDETSGPQAVPVAKQVSDPGVQHQDHACYSQPTIHISQLSSALRSTVGLSWGGEGTDRSGESFPSSQFSSHAQTQGGQSSSGLPQDGKSCGGYPASDDGRGGDMTDGVLPIAQLTKAQIFLLQEEGGVSGRDLPAAGDNSSYGDLASGREGQGGRRHQRKEQESRKHPDPRDGHTLPASGLTMDEEDTGSVVTDFEIYGSSPSPEPGQSLNTSSRGSARLQMQASSQGGHQTYFGRHEHMEKQNREEVQRLPMAPPSVSFAQAGELSSDRRASCAGLSILGGPAGKVEGSRGSLSHSKSNNDLDISCHGPADPNGYGGLQWTPAPLASLLGAKGLLEAGNGVGDHAISSVHANQGPAHQKRRTSRAGSRTVPANNGGDNTAGSAAIAGAKDEEAEPGFLARSL